MDLLRSWYLANLRKSSIANAVEMTPAALINADREQIEQLVLSGKRPGLTDSQFTEVKIRRRITICLALAGVALVLSLLLQLSTGNFTAVGLAVMLLPGMAFLSIAAIHFELQKQVFSVIQRIGDQAASALGQDLSGYEALQTSLGEMFKQYAEQVSAESLIVDSSRDLLCCLDRQLKITAITNSCLRLIQYSREQLLGRTLEELILNEDRPLFVTIINLTQKNTSSTGKILRVLTKDGLARDFSWTFEWSDSAELYFVLAEDVTDKKQLERARLHFISTMGHDIKIPLASAWAAIQSIEIAPASEHGMTEQQTKLVTRAENNIETLMGLLDELLEFERSESGQLPLDIRPVSTVELIDDAINAIRSQAELKSLKIHQHDVIDATIQADEGKLFRVLTNLLSNAIKFSPAENEILVTATSIGTSWEVRVRDHGPGIPKEYQHLIFERYERLPATSDMEGTGLGLSICKSIIESHHGLIGVDSPADGGSEFWFSVPVKRVT